jgi:hypothetical protein
MPSRAPKKPTIKKLAHEYFVKVSFVDIYGRNIGYDYNFILDRIKEQFPNARTSRRWVQDMAYILNRSEKLPVRRHSSRTTAEDYAKALLLKRSGRKAYSHITGAVKERFPDQHFSADHLRQLDRWLRNKGFTIPARPL